jgi:type IX secretion system PorP/SprF family membrane protein
MKKSIVILLFAVQGLFAQDVHFSQWYNNPLFSNPALTASFDGDYRITANQREQWASVSIPFSTTCVGLDMPIKNWGLGFQFLRDQSGSSRLSLTQFNLSVARSLEQWRLGMHLGFAQRTIDYSDLIFIDGGESISTESKNYMDLGLGINREFSFTSSDLNLGYSIFHINKPNRSFISTEDKLAIRHQLSSTLDYDLDEQWQLSPSAHITIQQNQREWMFGSQISFDISEYYYKSIQLEAGAYYRFGDALSCLIGVQYEQSYLAFSYDWNTSDLVPASNYLGAWELSFSHIIQSKILPKPKYKTCPTFL